MKASFTVIMVFLFYCFLLKQFDKFLTLEFSVALVPILSFVTIILIFVRKNKIKINLSYSFIKIAFIEFIVFLLISLIYAMLMSEYLGQKIFSYYFSNVLLFSPVLIVCYLILVVLGYKKKNDLIYYGNKKLLILKMMVKIFFLTFIYGSVCICLTEILTIERINFSQIDYYFYLLGLTADVVIALFGYTFVSHWFDNEVKSVDESFSGWLICIICYPPFLYLYKILLSQVDDYTWGDWAKGQWYYYPWLFLIISTWLLYWFSHAHFGFRFSNLTWRGLVNKGLYKYFRHPAYFFKNIYWWLYTIPFFGVSGLNLLHNFIVLSCISLIYYFRAKTEESHLMQFKEYRDYVAKIEKTSPWYRVKNIICNYFNSGIYSIVKRK